MSHHGGSSHSTDGQDEELLLSFWRDASFSRAAGFIKVRNF